MTTHDSRDQAALDQRLQALRSELDSTLKNARARLWTMRLVLAVLVLLTTGYLFYIYQELGKFDAQTVTDLAYMQIDPYIQQSPELVREELRRRAPEIIGWGEKAVLDAPAVGAAYLRQVFNEAVRDAFSKAQPQVEQAIRESLVAIKAGADKAGYNLNDKADVDRMVADAAAEFARHAGESVEQFKTEFNHKSEFILAGMTELAENKDLTPLQERHREVLLAFMALAERWKTEPPALGIEVAGEGQRRVDGPAGANVPRVRGGAAPVAPAAPSMDAPAAPESPAKP